MLDWTVVVPTLLAATVEWVEAFTIVLAVSLAIGWRAALGAAATAMAVLAVMTAATGSVPQSRVVSWLQVVIGVFLLLFGVRWLAKAIARQAGLKALHDEAEEFDQTRARLAGGDWYTGWAIAFKGVLLKGLEVWLIVVALGINGAWPSSASAAIVALIAVAAVGLLIRAPLARVPENAIKFAVGTMIVSFGTFWTLESLGGPAVWPGGDWSLLGLVIFYASGGVLLAALLHRPVRLGEVP